MQLNIIHLPHRTDRDVLLAAELEEQSITNYKIWDGILNTSNPKVGIMRAHKRIVEWAKYQNLQSVLIAEDDIKFTSKQAFEYFLAKEPENYDLYMGGIFYGKIGSDNSVSDFAGLTLYKINQKFYNVFLSLPEGKDMDRSMANKGKFIVCNPFVVTQQAGYSDNTKNFKITTLIYLIINYTNHNRTTANNGFKL